MDPWMWSLKCLRVCVNGDRKRGGASVAMHACIALCNVLFLAVGSVGCAFVNADGFCYQVLTEIMKIQCSSM